MTLDTIIQGDVIEVLKTLPDGIVQTCITSPPYWGLRDYGSAGQIGLEKTPEEYVAKMVAVFHEVKRVLRDDGTLWLNLGDSYAGNSSRVSTGRAGYGAEREGVYEKTGEGLKHKDLVGIPWRVAFALQADGWYLRSDIIWHKPNPMPESVTDRPTKSHEYIFLMAKSQKYYYNHEAIKEPGVTFENRPSGVVRNREYEYDSKENNNPEAYLKKNKTDKQRGHSRRHAGFDERWDKMTREEQTSLMRNKRDVWTVATKPYAEAHFATFPEKLIEPCVMAGAPKGGIVLDPFMGSGTTAFVARKLGRKYLGIELNAEYIKLAEKRLAQQQLL